jgi:hypothetical protein
VVLDDEYEQVYLHGGDDLLRVCFNMGIVYVSMTNETLFSKANTINAAFILDCVIIVLDIDCLLMMRFFSLRVTTGVFFVRICLFLTTTSISIISAFLNEGKFGNTVYFSSPTTGIRYHTIGCSMAFFLPFCQTFSNDPVQMECLHSAPLSKHQDACSNTLVHI